MIRVGFITLGCKVNIYESNAIKNELIKKGYEIVEPDSSCDVFIVNTCSVTNMSDAKSRKMIRKCIKMNPNAIMVAMGCYTQTNSEALNLEGIDILIGNGNKRLNKFTAPPAWYTGKLITNIKNAETSIGITIIEFNTCRLSLELQNLSLKTFLFVNTSNSSKAFNKFIFN